MRRETVFTLDSLYRGEFGIDAFTFGNGDHTVNPELSLAVMGALRGNEHQQLFTASQLINTLKRLEEAGYIKDGVEIRVIPCGNPYSLNTSTRFWAVDNTDINRMFPGYDQGETTQRIAAGIFEALRGYGYGVHLSSSYLPGEQVPHARVMDNNWTPVSLARLTGLQYAVVRKPEPVDVGTLGYNWSLFGTKCLTLFNYSTANIDMKATETAVMAILRLATRLGLISYDLHGGYITQVVKENHLVPIINERAGLLRRIAHPGDHVNAGECLARVYDPYTGEELEALECPVNGTVFFSHTSSLATQNSIIYRIIDDKIVVDE